MPSLYPSTFLESVFIFVWVFSLLYNRMLLYTSSRARKQISDHKQLLLCVRGWEQEGFQDQHLVKRLNLSKCPRLLTADFSCLSHTGSANICCIQTCSYSSLHTCSSEHKVIGVDLIVESSSMLFLHTLFEESKLHGVQLQHYVNN